MPMPFKNVQLELRNAHNRPLWHAALSALVPGLGQLAQGRLGAALVQFGTVAIYVGAVVAEGRQRAYFVALLWNLWSIIDAYRHEAD
jgi:hypothetical protein